MTLRLISMCLHILSPERTSARALVFVLLLAGVAFAPQTARAQDCGDGSPEGAECDDGNLIAGDGCDATCHIEAGWICDESEPSGCTLAATPTPAPTATPEPTPTPAPTATPEPTPTPAPTATPEPTPTPAPTADCGDGITTAPEGCDDGNLTSGDGCEADCTVMEGCVFVTSGEMEVLIYEYGMGLFALSEITMPVGTPRGFIRVLGVRGRHTSVGDLTFYLSGPVGASAILREGGCGTEDDFHFSFADGETLETPCPPTDGKLHAPLESLADLLAATPSLDGVWSFAVFDLVYDRERVSGVLNSWGLLACGEPPVPTPTPAPTATPGPGECGDGLVGAETRGPSARGVTTSEEECDDGNTEAGDGCDGSCVIEEGYTCEGEPSDCFLPLGLDRIVLRPTFQDYGVIIARGHTGGVVPLDVDGGLEIVVRDAGPTPGLGQEVSTSFTAAECVADRRGGFICTDEGTPGGLVNRVKIVQDRRSGGYKIKVYLGTTVMELGLYGPAEMDIVTPSGATYRGEAPNCRGGVPPEERLLCLGG